MMSKSFVIAAIISAAVSLPAFAQSAEQPTDNPPAWQLAQQAAAEKAVPEQEAVVKRNKIRVTRIWSIGVLH